MSLVRNFATVGVATIASRVLGFGRDILLAALLGAGPVAEAYVAAFRLPNLFRRILAEGALNAAFVPVYGGVLERSGDQEAARFAGQVIGALALILALLTALALILMPWVIYVQVPGFAADIEKFNLTVDMATIMFPYLALMSMLALLSGILNSHRRFAAAAFAPALLNVVLIGVLGWLWFDGASATAQTGRIIAYAVIAGGIAQLLLAIAAIWRARIAIRLGWPRWTEESRKLVKLMVPGILAGGITQLNIFIGTIIASAAAGAVSFLYYADRLYQLPLGVIGIAVGVVLLPELSRNLQASDEAAASRSFATAMQFSLALTLPAAVALAVIPAPIVNVLFAHGAFTAADAAATANAVAAFAIGLPSFVLIKVFSPAYFARQDTRTPMIFAAIGMVLNVGIAYLLFPYWQHVGIAAATSAAGWTNAALLFIGLRGQPVFQLSRATYRALALILCSAVLMGCVLVFLEAATRHWTTAADLWTQIGGLAFLVMMGAGVYALLCQYFGILSMRSLSDALRRKP